MGPAEMFDLVREPHPSMSDITFTDIDSVVSGTLVDSASCDHPSTDNFYSPQNFDFYSQNPYQPLDRSSRSIRLLEVRKVKVDYTDVYEYTFTDWITLEEASNSYIAISYCAGNPEDTQAIIVNGIPFNAFASLARSIAATTTYCYSMYNHDVVRLWVDQICINQSDSVERAHQVGFMGSIYRSAREVTICLASNKHDQSGAIQSMLGLYWNTQYEKLQRFPLLLALMDARRVCSRPHNTDYTFEQHEEQLKKEITDKIQWYMRRHTEWRDLLEMIRNPWFKRAWTFQEFVLAKNASFLYCGESISWRVFTVVLTLIIEALERITKEVTNGTQNGNKIREAMRTEEQQSSLAAVRFILSYKMGNSRSGNLVDLLLHSRLCGASDKRDHIFAFLGLAKDTYGISPDYDSKRSIQDIFTETARHIISHEKTLNILSYAITTRGVSMSALPTWVPDWTSAGVERDEKWVAQCKTLAREHGELVPRFFNEGTTLEVWGWPMQRLLIQFNNEDMPEAKWNFFAIIDEHLWETASRSLTIRTSQDTKRYDEIWILDGVDLPLVLRAINRPQPHCQVTDGHELDRWDTYDDYQPREYQIICDLALVKSVFNQAELDVNSLHYIFDGAYESSKRRIHLR